MQALSIAKGLNKRGHKAIYNGDLEKAQSLFKRAVMIEAGNDEYIIDLIYVLNQQSYFEEAIELCYSLFGKCENDKEINGTLYFLAAEAFGGLGCPEACVQMLKLCVDREPEGKMSRDATDFMNDVLSGYEVDVLRLNSGVTTHFGMLNGLFEPLTVNYEALHCIRHAGELIANNSLADALAIVKNEIDAGNNALALICYGIMLSFELGDNEYLNVCCEKLKAVEDYTHNEIMLFAHQMDALAIPETAFENYKTLLYQEDLDTDILFGCAVAAEKTGRHEQALKFASRLSEIESGVGPGTRLLGKLSAQAEIECGYLYFFTDNEILSILEFMRRCTYESINDVAEAFMLLRRIDSPVCDEFISKAELSLPFVELEMRKLALSSQASLFRRAQAAKVLVDAGKKVLFNSGTDFIWFDENVFNAVMKFKEQAEKSNEQVD